MGKYKKWENTISYINNDDVLPSAMAERAWKACKNEILEMLENEMDSGDWSLATVTQKIRDEI